MATNSRTSRLTLIRNELDRYAVFSATAIFTLVALAHKAGVAAVPGGTLTLLLFPAVLFAASLRRPHFFVNDELRGAAAWSFLFMVALALTPTLTRTPIYAVGLTAIIATAILTARMPAAAVVFATFLTAIIGSFQAYLGMSPSIFIDLMLAAVWIVVMGRVVLGRPYSFVVWPAVIGCIAFFGLTTIDLVTSENYGVAFLGFRTTIWYMLAFLAIAYAGWSRETYARIARGLVAVTFVVTAYVALRWAIGPAGAERELASATANGINVDPVDKSLRTVGSFQTAHQMAFWSAFMGPFCLAAALWLRGRWRVLAGAAVALSLLAIIASEVRGPLPGFVGGVVLVLAVHQGARAFPGFKIGVAAAAIGAVLSVGALGLALGASDPERLERFERILDPGSDPTFVARQLKWEQVLDSVDENPFGRGLGTAGAAQVSGGDTLELAEFNIDNSYLKIAYEQGLAVMVFFVVVSLGLLGSIVVASLRARSKQAAALGMGACGTLVSLLVSFYTGLFIESAPIVSAWLVVGLGLSYFVARDLPQPASRPARASAGPPLAPAPSLSGEITTRVR